MPPDTHLPVTVWRDDERHELALPRGSNLRRALLAAGLTPYTWLTRQANCGGRGLCATCGVRLDAGPRATHWHDRAADRFGYPRLSCQITVEQPLTVRLVTDKIIWGGRRRRDSAESTPPPHRDENDHGI